MLSRPQVERPHQTSRDMIAMQELTKKKYRVTRHAGTAISLLSINLRKHTMFTFFCEVLLMATGILTYFGAVACESTTLAQLSDLINRHQNICCIFKVSFDLCETNALFILYAFASND